MNLESRSLKKVKLNNKKGIKKKIKQGTIFITTALLLMQFNFIKCGSEKNDLRAPYNVTTEHLQNKKEFLLLKEKNRQIERLKKIQERNEKNNFTSSEAYSSLKNEIIIELLQKYCNVYNLDFVIVYRIAKENTEDFTSKEFLNNNNFMNEDTKYDNLELSILEFVRDVKFNFKNYNINIKEVTNDNYEKKKTIRKTIRHYSKLYNVDANLILSIELIESGYYLQPIAAKRNNPGSLRGNSDFYSYENLEQGIIEHIRTVKKYYINQGLNTPNAMQRKYCPDGSNWAKCVNEKLNVLNKNPNAYELYDEEIVKAKK